MESVASRAAIVTFDRVNHLSSGVQRRTMPYPYRAMLAICSDRPLTDPFTPKSPVHPHKADLPDLPLGKEPPKRYVARIRALHKANLQHHVLSLAGIDDVVTRTQRGRHGLLTKDPPDAGRRRR